MSNVSLVNKVRESPQKPEPDGYLWASTKTVILGDFYDDPTIFGLGVRAGVGCIPVLGQLMDLSDTAAWVILAYERGIDDEEVMLNGAILFIGYVPGVGDVLRNLLKALVGNEALPPSVTSRFAVSLRQRECPWLPIRSLLLQESRGLLQSLRGPL